MGVNCSSYSQEKYRLPLSPPSCNNKSKKNRKRKNKKKNSYLHESSPTFASHVGDEPLVAASHSGGISLVTTSHTSDGSPTSMSHVIDYSLDSMSWVGGISPIFLLKETLTSTIHVGDPPPTTTSHVGGIKVDKKPRSRISKTKFPCMICKGDHLTHLCPHLSGVQRLSS